MGEDDGIKTITYDEYVNAGIPDALLEGLGFAESLSKDPVDTEDENDVGKDPAEQTEAPDADVPRADVSGADLRPVPSLVAAAQVVPANLIQLLSSHIVPAVMTGNSSAVSPSSAAGNNIISSTPPTLSLVDRHGNILPTLPSVPGLIGTACSSSLVVPGDAGKAASRAVRFVDQNGRVLSDVPFPSSAADASRIVRVVDDNGRIVASRREPQTRVVDQNGRVITAASGSSETVGIPQANATGESDAGNFQVSNSAGSGSSLKRKEPRTRNSTEEHSVAKSW